VEKGDVLTYLLTLKNDGLVDDPVVTATNTLPSMLELVGIDPPSQGTLISSNRSFTWTTSLAKDQIATLTYRAVISYQTSSGINNTAIAADGLNDPLALTAQASFKVQPLYLPIIYKK
jgi:uncharacterized repeat protein (TIGR01451 family)